MVLKILVLLIPKPSIGIIQRRCSENAYKIDQSKRVKTAGLSYSSIVRNIGKPLLHPSWFFFFGKLGI